MPIEVVLPKVDMDMESGVIAAWKVADGDFVRAGDVLFEMETDKSVMEVEAPGTGTIRALSPITGEPVAVGTVVAWIHDETAQATPPAPAEAAAPHLVAAPAVVATPAAIATPAAPSAPTAAADTDPGGIRATPFARHTARLHDVDLAGVAGSGPRGRIGAQDVTAHIDARAAANHAGSVVPFNPVRRIVAQRLAESVRTAPHFYLTAHIEMTALRDAIATRGRAIAAETGVKPSVTVMLAWILGRVLPQHPLVNASIDGEAARLHAQVHIGIAMDREGDLVVPVLRDAHARSLPDLTREYVRLRDAVRGHTPLPSEMRGGTFTISNLGMYGVDAFTAIINQPESAILAIGRTVDTPVGRDGAIVLRPMATFSLSSDHRIVDGITAARFMAHLRKTIEAPDAMLD